MKHALSSGRSPARVRRGQFRAFTLGLGASALAMACSFGEVDNGSGANIPPVDDNDPGVAPGDEPSDTGNEPTTNRPNTNQPTPSTVDPQAEPYDSDDLFAGPQGTETKEILQKYCGDCHIGAGGEGDFGYLLSVQELVTGGKVIPGAKEDSPLYARMVAGQMPPAFYRAINGFPTYPQMDVVGRWIDELDLPDPEGVCEPYQFMDVDTQIELMQRDIQSLDPVTEAPFTRYLTINYSSNASDCGRALERQRYALFKGINSVSTDPQVGRPEPIDTDKTIYRINIKDYGWDREIDLLDDGTILFRDGWEAIIGDELNREFMIEYQGDNADELKLDADTLVPFIPVNVFIQATEFGDLYYTLIGGKGNLFDFEREVLLIDTIAEAADDRVMRAGFSDSGVSKQERVLNRFDSGIAGGLNYWISFDFDGGNGNGTINGVSNGFEIDVANESIYDDPLGFAFAGGEAIFSLPNGFQAYYVAAADGTRLNEAPVGVVIDPAQNNGLVTNGASCGSCHAAGMIPFTDTVRQYVEENRVQFDNDTYESVMRQYVDFDTFKAAMDRDSAVHVNAVASAGVPPKTQDPISRVYLDFQLGNVDARIAAGELGVELEVLLNNLDLLDPRLANLGEEEGFISRPVMQATFLDTVCILQSVQDNTPVGCP